MSLEEKFIGNLNEDLSVTINNAKDCSSLLNKFVGPIEILIRKISKKRTDKQNRWYWGVCIRTIIEETKRIDGEEYTKDQIHFYILSQVINVKFRTETVMDRTIMIFEIPSTTQMSTYEFMNFKENIQRHFAERKGIVIPDPTEKTYINELVTGNF